MWFFPYFNIECSSEINTKESNVATFKCSSPSFSFHFIDVPKTFVSLSHIQMIFMRLKALNPHPSTTIVEFSCYWYCYCSAAAKLLLTIIVFDARDIQCHRLTHVHSNRKRACWFRLAFMLFLNHCALFNCSSVVEVQLSVTVDFKSNSRI